MIRWLPSPRGGLLIATVDTPATANREAARRLVRQALRETLDQQLGEDVTLIEVLGQPLRLAPPHAGIGVSVSHEQGLSLLAIHLAGPVGVDLLALDKIPTDPEERQRVSIDYLGESISDPQRFAEAWTQQEASSKCLGQPLAEGMAQVRARCLCFDLALPGGHAGSVAILAER